MAWCPALFKDHLLCPVCHDVFRDPVLLICSHSFCQLCLEQFWQHTESPTCPLCRTSSPVYHPPRNLALRNLCEVFTQENKQTASDEAEILCSLHNIKLTHYCLEDKQPVCEECQASTMHDKHDIKPLHEVAMDLKLDLQRELASLKERLNLFKNAKETCLKVEQHIKCQAMFTEALLRKQFEKLHRFLWDEEEARVAALREEEGERIHTTMMKMNQINRDILVLANKVKAYEEQIDADNFAFLQNQNREATVQRTECEQKDPEINTTALIDVAKHLGNLKFRVWKKMMGTIKYTPLILDPNTAHPFLHLTNNLTGVELHNSGQEVPGNPLRYNAYSSVLGSEGFDSGEHCWTIDVGNSSAWAIGVISESAHKHTEVLSKEGLWHIGYYKGKYGHGLSNEILTPIKLKEKIQRIRVLLDYDRGYVSFYDSDNDTHVHTFEHTFTEQVYPYFCNACPDGVLRILPVGLSVTEHMS